MDIVSYVGTAAQVVGGGVGVFLATEAVKRIRAIPINEGMTTHLRATAAAFSAVAVLLLGLANGNLRPDDLQGAVLAILGVLGAWGVSHQTHRVVNR